MTAYDEKVDESEEEKRDSCFPFHTLKRAFSEVTHALEPEYCSVMLLLEDDNRTERYPGGAEDDDCYSIVSEIQQLNLFQEFFQQDLDRAGITWKESRNYYVDIDEQDVEKTPKMSNLRALLDVSAIPPLSPDSVLLNEKERLSLRYHGSPTGYQESPAVRSSSRTNEEDITPKSSASSLPSKRRFIAAFVDRVSSIITPNTAKQQQQQQQQQTQQQQQQQHSLYGVSDNASQHAEQQQQHQSPKRVLVAAVERRGSLAAGVERRGSLSSALRVPMIGSARINQDGTLQFLWMNGMGGSPSPSTTVVSSPFPTTSSWNNNNDDEEEEIE